jgi:nicotinamide-nucleotide amidase
MELELVTIGNELLLGFTLDSNSAYLARALAPVGGRVVRNTTVADDGKAIGEAVRDALARTGFVITSGGLGPTRDDVTKKAVADIVGQQLVLDETYLQQLRERFAAFGRRMADSNRTQAERPEGATVLPNPIGTAPGLWVESDAGVVVMLPGVPSEFRALTDAQVAPRVAARARGTAVVSRTLRTTGIPESTLGDTISHLADSLVPMTMAFLPSLAGVDVRLTVADRTSEEARIALDDAARQIDQLLGPARYGEESDDLADILIGLLGARGETLAVAESCTGGLVGARLTAIPGSSRVFVGGVIAYSNRLKERLLDVTPAALETYGAVSEVVALEMARGVRTRTGAEAGLSITGVAGPGGGTGEKPVGTVWLAASLGTTERAIRRVFPGNRDDIRQRAAQAALDLLRRQILRDDEEQDRSE